MSSIPPKVYSLLTCTDHRPSNLHAVPDAELTPLGREQSAALRKDTEPTFQKDADLIVSSPVSSVLACFYFGAE